MERAAGAPGFLLWLQEGALGQAMRQSPAFYPAAEILHILGFALLVGAIVALDLRLLGAARGLPVDRVAAHLLPLAIAGFGVAAPMGVLLFISDAAGIAANPAFRIKLVLLLLAGLNALALHKGPWPDRARWIDPPPRAKAHAAASIALWVGVVAAGRLIAYF